jgi:phosphoglycerol transferase MdoB-like AlkP superfamily enzyme
LNLYQKCNECLETEQRRRQLLMGLVCGFWGWQCVWLCAFFGRMAWIDDYESLFLFQADLDRYSASFLIRFFVGLVQTSSFNLSSIWQAFASSFGAGIIFFLLLSVLYWQGMAGKLSKFWCLAFALLCGFSMACLAFGLGSKSLYEVIVLLRFLGSVGFLVSGALAVWAAAGMVKAYSTFVHSFL